GRGLGAARLALRRIVVGAGRHRLRVVVAGGVAAGAAVGLGGEVLEQARELLHVALGRRDHGRLDLLHLFRRDLDLSLLLAAGLLLRAARRVLLPPDGPQLLELGGVVAHRALTRLTGVG